MSDGTSIPQDEIRSSNPDQNPTIMFKYPVAETGRGIDGYRESLGFASESKFIEYIRGKSICDIGSGLGILAVDVALRKIDADVNSVSPRLTHENFGKMQMRGILNEVGKGHSEKEISAAIAKHDSKAVSALAQSLPFPDDQFDLVFDSYAVTWYRGIGSESYKKSIQEMIRILKPGGKLRIGARGTFGSPESEGLSSQEKTIKELGLSYELIRVDPESDPELVHGIEITKPLSS